MDFDSIVQVINRGLEALSTVEMKVIEDTSDNYSSQVYLYHEEIDKTAIIEGLPNKTREQLVDGLIKCPICWDQIQGDQRTKRGRRCRHYFHAGCLEEWLLREDSPMTCPMCRKDI